MLRVITSQKDENLPIIINSDMPALGAALPVRLNCKESESRSFDIADRASYKLKLYAFSYGFIKFFSNFFRF
jgi:hypothetical protein